MTLLMKAIGEKASLAMLVVAVTSASTSGLASAGDGKPLDLHLSLSAPVLTVRPDLLVGPGLDDRLVLSSRTAPRVVDLGPEFSRISGTKRYGRFWDDDPTLKLSYWPAPHVGIWLAPACDLLFRDQRPATSSGFSFAW
jgi:hypothetical protein